MGLFSSALGFVGDIGGALINKKSVKDSNKQQNEYNVKQWERENEYNKPINQMKRLEEAGLNPNLVYGNGSVVGNTSGSIAGKLVSDPARWEVDLSDMFNLEQRYLQNKQIENQIKTSKDLAKAGVSKINAETKRINAETQTLTGQPGSSFDVSNNRFKISPSDTQLTKNIKQGYNSAMDVGGVVSKKARGLFSSVGDYFRNRSSYGRSIYELKKSNNDLKKYQIRKAIRDKNKKLFGY